MVTNNNNRKDGLWVNVLAENTAFAWAYNYCEINDSIAGSSIKNMNGIDYESISTPSRFTERPVISKSDSTNDYYSMERTNAKYGSITLM